MVRPPKPGDIKQTIPAQKSQTKAVRNEIEERFKTEAVSQKKNMDKIKLQAKNASTSQKTKVSPKTSKLSKLQAQPITVNRRNSISQSKSHTSKPGSPVLEKRTKIRKPSLTKKKSPLQSINREDAEKTLPLSFQLDGIESAIKSKLGKMGKIVVGAKKIKKSSLKKPSKEIKNINVVKPESATSLKNFRMSYLTNELPNTTKLPSAKKSKKPATQKKVTSKVDQEESSKEAKNKRKKSYIRRRANVGITGQLA